MTISQQLATNPNLAEEVYGKTLKQMRDIFANMQGVSDTFKNAVVENLDEQIECESFLSGGLNEGDENGN